MSPPELIFALALCVFLPLAITRLIIGYKRDRVMRDEGSALSTSELETLVRRAVEDAVRPLQDQIADLEDRLAGRLPAVELDEEPGAERAAARTVGRRRQSA